MNSPARIVTQRSYTDRKAQMELIEKHLEAALHYVRSGSSSLAVGKACRAASLLKQSCAEALAQIGRGTL